MDKGLQLQIDLSRKGEKFFDEFTERLEKAKTVKLQRIKYLMSSGVEIVIDKNFFHVYFIIGDERKLFYLTYNYASDIIITKEAICHFLINNNDYSFEMCNDVQKGPNYWSISFGW